MEMLMNFYGDESGATAVEYALMLAFIALAIVGSVQTLGTTLSNTFTTASGMFGS
jgi:pilus assembly protein Flp/PilA